MSSSESGDVRAVLARAQAAAAAGRDSLEEARALYRSCLSQALDPHAKGGIRQALWDVERRLGLHPLFFSQAGQDRFLFNTLFKDKRDGVFVEIGGYNGWTGSNCYFFEKTLNWTGLIVEASPHLVAEISGTRSSPVVHAAISDRDGTAEFIEVTAGYKQMGGLAGHYAPGMLDVIRRNPGHAERTVEVPTMRLESLLKRHALDRVDYCSIDVEGAERAILSSFDFGACDISVFSVENNRKSESTSVRDILEPAGYRLLEVIGVDEIFRKVA